MEAIIIRNHIQNRYSEPDFVPVHLYVVDNNGNPINACEYSDTDIHSFVEDTNESMHLNNAAIYHNTIGDYDKSKSILIHANTSIGYINYSNLYDQDFVILAYKIDPDSSLVNYYYTCYCIANNNIGEAKKSLGKLFSQKGPDIGYYIFHIGFEFENIGDHKNADICFKFLKRLDPTKDCNNYWINEGVRLTSCCN